MCRSIKTLREPFTENVSSANVQTTALQYVHKISGFRQPTAHNAAAFEAAVQSITAATQDLLDQHVVKGTARP